MKKEKIEAVWGSAAIKTVASIVICSFLMQLCSIPLISIGASYCASYCALTELRRSKGEANIFTAFFGGVKSRFKCATGLFICQLLCLFVLLVDFYFSYLISNSLTGRLLLGFFSAVAALSTGLFTMAYLLLAKSESSTLLPVLKEAVILCLRHPFAVLALLFLQVALLGLIAFTMASNSIFAYFTIIFGLPGCQYCSLLITDKYIFKKEKEEI